jgi:alpha-beta hydrolase superfamily lysophospholipase
MGWLSEPTAGGGTTGVVVIPPLGYEYWTTHRTLRTLAEELAGNGCSVVRIDLDGTGDSAGNQWDPGRSEAWRRSVRTAAEFLRSRGATDVVLAGIRYGGTLALLEGPAVKAKAVVAWAPVVEGKRYVRQLQLLGTEIPEDPSHPELAGAIAQAGTIFLAETLQDIRMVDLTTLATPPAAEVLIIERDDQPAGDALVDRITRLGANLDHRVLPGTGDVLDRPTEYAEVPGKIVDAIRQWVGSSQAVGRATMPGPALTDRWQDRAFSEEVVRLGGSDLVGVLTEPQQPRVATVVWLNSGSEPHVGPGRAWVEYARCLARSGYASVRLDFSGWGESPDLGHAPGRPYDAHSVAELQEVVDSLRRGGHQRVVVAGLCAGAWIALRAALTAQFDGVIAINPQLYWQPGDPVEADIATETRVRREMEIRRFKFMRFTGLWWVLDAAGIRHPTADWLRDLDRSDCRVLTVFAAGDDGLEFLEDRVGRTWSTVRRRGGIDLAVIPDIDHPMHRVWKREAMIETLRAWLDNLTSEPSSGGA